MFKKNNQVNEKNKLFEVQPKQIFEVYSGFAGTQALLAAIELNLFQFIANQLNTVERMAPALNISARSLRILLDALVALKILNKAKNVYQLSSESKQYLVKGGALYIGDVLLRYAFNFENWHPLLEALRKGPSLNMKSCEERMRGIQDSSRDIFSTSYASAVFISKKLGVGKSLKNLKVLDIGAGSAAWSLAFVLADAQSQVDALDFEGILPLTREFVQKFRVEKQYNYLAGDVLEYSLKKEHYDVILIGHLCHHLGEQDSKKLFKKCHEALRPKGRVLIAEYVANDLRTGDKIALLFGLKMILQSTQGDVFTVKEFKKWLAGCKFRKTSALSAVYPTTVISAQKG
ncbi:MAG: class I SAM-dependent methyltransferase [Deltaproteobacteria bacterium]|nr:class I SAM-dependent methyltransferase [Deltaproteobacteria bacterium]